MIRDDLSNKVIHFTRGSGKKHSKEFIKMANENFYKIITSGMLLGSVKNIRAGCKCICFTESPISKFPYIFDVPDFCYAPLGVMVDKSWLFEKGGRPVIYQPDMEYDCLSKSKKYRHKVYDPTKGIDFSWEREWRIATDKLHLDDTKTTYIVPNRKWEDDFKNRHTSRIKGSLRGKMIYGTGGKEEIIKSVYSLRWHFIVLEDLGINVKWG